MINQPAQTNQNSLDELHFKIRVFDKAGLINNIVNIFADETLSISRSNYDIQNDTPFADFDLFTNDPSDNERFDILLRVCRKIQSTDDCNRLQAEFFKFPINSGDIIQNNKSIPTGIKPLESIFTNVAIDEQEPLHPANIENTKFEPIIFELDEVVADFIKDPTKLLKVDPLDLEKIIAKAYQGHGLDVKVTGGPKDHGIDADVTAYVPVSLPRKFAQHIKIGIQVKRYKLSNKVKEREVRNFYGSLLAEDYDRGILVTTSSLTASASQYLKSRRTVGDRITVIAGDEVLELLISYCKQRTIPFWR